MAYSYPCPYCKPATQSRPSESRKTSLKREILYIVAAIACAAFAVLLFVQPSILPIPRAEVRILDLAPYVTKAENGFCINKPELGKLYYVMTFETNKPISIRLSTERAMLPGTIRICDVKTSECRDIKTGMITAVKPGTYKLYIGTSLPVPTICVMFTG